MIISLHKEYLVCLYMLTSEYLHTHFRLVILSIVLSQALRKMIVCVHLPQKQFLIFTFLASCLTTEDLTAMMGMATETLYNKDDCVIKEGSSNQHLFFIAEGCKLFYIECLQPPRILQSRDYCTRRWYYNRFGSTEEAWELWWNRVQYCNF